MNILLTCAGRRNYLVDYFKDALDSTGKVYVANSTSDATSMIVADGAFVAPPLYSDEYIDFLKNICRNHDIRLLVSLFDLELPVLAGRKGELEELGVTVAVSDPDVISICNNKMKTVAFGKELGLKTLYTTTQIEDARKEITKGNLTFPLFIKPRWGMGSIAMQKAENENELVVLFEKVKRDLHDSYLQYDKTMDPQASVIIQQMAEGQEFGLDVVNDLNANYVTTFVKRKLGMRSGETDGAITEDIPELRQLGKNIGTHLAHVGNLDVDVFWNGKELVILEMNARFGGGYPFSHLAGANLPKAYIEWAEGNTVKVDYFNIEFGVKGLKELKILSCSQINLIQNR